MADDRVKRFREITGASEAEAASFLGSRTDVEACVNEFFDVLASGGGPPPAEPEVRAPIAPMEDVMLPPEAAFPHAIPIVVDNLRDFRVESEIQTARQEAALAGGSDEASKRFEDLFRPPIDILFRDGDFTEAKEFAKDENKWVLIDLQNSKVFLSVVLNRDLWQSVSLKSYIQEHFLLTQYNIESVEGSKLQRLYKVEDTDFPHIEVIDPRTGESLETLGGEGVTLEPVYVTAFLKAFIHLNGSPDKFDPPKKVTPRDVRRLLEEERELQEAIQRSMT
ncbi:UBX domain-containing protein 7 [Neocloeon triangulifer]|uniref:UBX domain-containing protein 7 n=1 Tax=Neocloeon triangulifer TaxID=2078957 RepID=UPI00286F1816|nr:UBX domain-containing protein 7 [Neocloeon triangulifer]